MRYIVLVITLLVINGCSTNRLFLFDEIDKVNVVKYTPYIKHHRAYFTRNHLKPVIKKNKYFFVYNAKKQDLALVLHRRSNYFLYSFTKPDAQVMKLDGKPKVSIESVLHSFAKAGYKPANLTRLGYTANVGLRRYKGVKTLMVEVKEYRNLKKAYEKAIKTYQAKRILGIDALLPKKFIYPYFIYYYKRAKTASQKNQLRLIAKKLHIRLKEKHFDKKRIPAKKSTDRTRTKKIPTKKKKEKNPVSQPSITQPEIDYGQPSDNEADDEVITVIEPQEESRPYQYYLNEASVYELSNYLDDPKSRQHLTFSQYSVLKQRLDRLQEDRILKEASLETLIAEYKKNKKPKFKKRIMELMKEKQEEEAKN